MSEPREVMADLARDLVTDGLKRLSAHIPGGDLGGARPAIEALLAELLVRYGEELLLRLFGNDWPAKVTSGRTVWRDER